MKKIILTLGIVFTLLCLLTASIIVWFGLSDNIHKSDVGIILGNHVHRSGRPSARLIARINEGATLYQQGMIKHIIVSGGINRYHISEAAAMKNYLVTHDGIPASVIIVDSQGSNTWNTAVNAKAIMQKNGFNSAIAISQYFHILRTVISMKRCGVSPVYHAHPSYFEWRDVYSVPREVLAIYYYFLFHHYSATHQ